LLLLEKDEKKIINHLSNDLLFEGFNIQSTFYYMLKSKKKEGFSLFFCIILLKMKGGSMGRKRLDIKKVTVGITVRKDIVDFCKENKINISAVSESALKKYIEDFFEKRL